MRRVHVCIYVRVRVRGGAAILNGAETLHAVYCSTYQG